MDKDNVQNELNELSPFLSQHKKNRKKAEAMPADYFVNFEDRLMHRLHEEEALIPKQEESKSDNKSGFLALLFSFLEPRMLAGVAVVIFITTLGWQYLNAPSPSEATPLLLADLSIEETRGYVLENIEEFSTNDIAAVMEEPTIEAIQEDLEIKEILEEEPIVEKVSTEKSNLDKALEKLNEEDLLDELSEEDLEGAAYELF